MERKFLVADDSYRSMAIYKSEIVQGYLSINPDATVRVRINGNKAFITVKAECRSRPQRMGIPCRPGRGTANARNMLPKPPYREDPPHSSAENGLKWEIDEFHGELDGLTIAEIELPEPESAFVIPPFIGEEVTGNPRYYNSVLSAI